MRYFVFDLDETLVEMYPISYFIASLRIMEDHLNSLYVPKHFEQSLETAYQLFVHAVLEAEKGSRPLGLLRPGILEVMKALQRLKEEDIINGVMIYSNNPHLYNLQFIADIIHKHVKSKHLIRECIHLHHELRQSESYFHTRLIHKTWEGVRYSLIHGKNSLAPSTILPSDVYFFDDLDHIDLQNTLGNHYIQIPPYTHYASFDRLAALYRKAIMDAGVEQPLFIAIVCDLLRLRIPKYITEEPTLDDMIQLFRMKLDETPSVLSDESVSRPAKKEEGIAQMWSVIHSIQPPSMKLKRVKRHRKGRPTRKLRRTTLRK